MAGLCGKVLGGFRIVEQVRDDESAQGIVCKAVCVSDSAKVPVPKGQVVALKVMPVHDDDQQKQWLKLERRTRELVLLNHPNVVRYFGCFCEQGEWNQLHVIVQEFLEGETLKEKLRRNPSGLDVDEGLRIIALALAGLAHTASKGIVHRDIKPGNIIVCGDFRKGGGDYSVKLIDFEIAKRGQGSTTASTGNMRGSFNYMAPEFLDAKFRGDQLSDVFSMGVTLHETLTGKLPYALIDGNGEDAILDFVARWKGLSDGRSPVLVSSDINRLLAHTEGLFAGCLSPGREQRFAGFEAFREALKSVRFRTLSNPGSGSSYQMLQYVGKGGFGEVFKARETKTGQIVAIKHLRRAKYADRFKREAKILSMLADDCFVRFVESFSRDFDGRVQEFLVMGFLDGMPGNSLWDAIRRSRGAGLPRRDVLVAFARYAHGLRLLHDAGIFHRDVKPANLYFPVGRPEAAAIMDLGIARDTNGTMTVGSVPGTPDYMPPEVVTSGSRGEGAMDVYALGLCLYEALTAKTAFARLPPDIEGFRKLVERVNAKVPPRFDDSRVDRDTARLLADMTAFNPASRIGDAGEVERRLLALLNKLEPRSAAAAEEESEPPTTTVATLVPPPATFAAAELTKQPASPVAEQDTSSFVTMPTIAPQLAPRPSQQRAPTPALQSPPEAESRPATLSAPIDNPRAKPDGGRARTGLKIFFIWVAILVFGGIGALRVFSFARQAWKEFYSERRLAAVLEAYRGADPGAADKENEWIVEFNPQSYSWLRLDAGEYAKCTNRIAAIKRQAEAGVAIFEWTARFENCVAEDGTLRGDAFQSLAALSLPGDLEGDDRIKASLAELRRAVRDEFERCVAIGDVASRRRRLQSAAGILANSWTEKLFGDAETRRMKKILDHAGSICVGSVRNLCDGEIEVCGVRVAVNEAKAIAVEDGHPERQLVTRAGRKAISLPPDFDGTVFEVADSLFESVPGRAAVPKVGEGVRFLFRNREYSGGDEIELAPGRHEGKYTRGEKFPGGKIYGDFPVEFTVKADAKVDIPGPGAWKYTEEYENYLVAPVDVEVPALNAGETCRIDGVAQSPGSVKLAPGSHVCVFEKPDHLPQTNSLEVTMGKGVALVAPRDWRPTAGLTNLREAEKITGQESWQKLQQALQGIVVNAPENVATLAALRQKAAEWQAAEMKRIEAERLDAEKAAEELARKAAEQKAAEERARKEKLENDRRNLRSRLEELLADDPLASRRERLRKARDILADGKTMDILEESEALKWRGDFAAAEELVVGKIRNDCSFPFDAGGLSVAPGQMRVASYNSKKSNGLVLKAKGYLDLQVGKELDGVEIPVSERQWTPADVVVKIGGAQKDVQCVFNGMPVKSEFKVKPGKYTLDFKRDGYESQAIGFQAALCDGCTVDVPLEWKPLPVSVSVPVLEAGVKCFLGSSEVVHELRLEPGRKYEFKYRKADCVDQSVELLVETGKPAVLQAPSAWTVSENVRTLEKAEQCLAAGKWDEADKLSEKLTLQSAANIERLKTLREGVKREKNSRESIDLAQLSYSSENWYECIRYYHEAWASGHLLSPEERKMIEHAYGEEMPNLTAMLKKALHDIEVGRTPIRDPEAIRKDMRQLDEWIAAMRK